MSQISSDRNRGRCIGRCLTCGNIYILCDTVSSHEIGLDIINSYIKILTLNIACLFLSKLGYIFLYLSSMKIVTIFASIFCLNMGEESVPLSCRTPRGEIGLTISRISCAERGSLYHGSISLGKVRN